MKNFFKAASILAAVSMMFAFASCQQQDPETPTKSDPAPVFKAETTEPVDLAPLGVTSITEVKVADEKIATVKAEGTKVTVTSVAKGTTAATVKVAGKKDGKDATGEVTFSITVAETGKITTTNPSGELTAKEETGENPGETPTDPENPGEDPVVPPAATGFVVDITASGELHDALNAIALKGSLAEGTYDGITLAGNSIIRANDKSKIVLETKGTISFSVTKGQKITLKLGSTSSSNTSAIQLSGAVTTDIVLVVGTSYDPIEYTAAETGTVTINACADSTNYGRGTRVTYIAVE